MKYLMYQWAGKPTFDWYLMCTVDDSDAKLFTPIPLKLRVDKMPTGVIYTVEYKSRGGHRKFVPIPEDSNV